jgi:hypothetical protein
MYPVPISSARLIYSRQFILGRYNWYQECRIYDLNFVIIKISIKKKRIQNINILKLKVVGTNRTTKDI